jgi:hypothetical protein
VAAHAQHGGTRSQKTSISGGICELYPVRNLIASIAAGPPCPSRSPAPGNMAAAHRSLLALAALVLLLSVSVRRSHAGKRGMWHGPLRKGHTSGWRRRSRQQWQRQQAATCRPGRMWLKRGSIAPLGRHAACCMHSPHSHAPSPLPCNPRRVPPQPPPTPIHPPAHPSAAVAGTAKIKISTVAAYNTGRSCWIVVSGGVYNVTSYISRHPGAAQATCLVHAAHPGVAASCCLAANC